MQPNIVLINCDDVGYGDPSCYGSTCNHTPRLDRMAEQGMRFTDFYMAASVCSPSRAAMLTGCYPARIGFDGTGPHGQWVLFPGDPRGLHPDEVTIGDLLRQAGYRTGLIGKWHLGDQANFLPQQHGFDEYLGLPYSNDMSTDHSKWAFPPLPLLEGQDIAETEPDQTQLTARYTQAATQFIQRHRDQPFFLYVAHLYTHVPLRPDPRFVADSHNGDYGAEMACIDWSTGVILDTLAELGLDEKTLVIFTSDNGSNTRNGASNQPLRGGKGSTHEGGQRVPMIARWPGEIPAGSVCEQVCTAMDFLPTFAQLAEVALPSDRQIDGHDIRPLLFDISAITSPYEAFFYYNQDHLEAVRAGQWKLRLVDGTLYDLSTDIGETTDRAAEHPDVVQRLEAHARRASKDLGDRTTQITGNGRRAGGWVDTPTTLTGNEADHPFVVAAYD